VHPSDPALTPSPVAPRIRSRRRTAGIIGLGRALPPTVVENGPIAERIGADPAWITKRTGISARRRSADGESLSDLAIEAGQRALEAAGLNASYVDAVLVATILALRHRVSPPTLGYEQPEDGMDLDYVLLTAQPMQTASDERAVALSNSFGFGGHNVTLCLEVA
jgi:3-oxoacyl-(acyl-carrier-protein) synthase